MELGLYPTLGILLLAGVIFALAEREARRPSEPLKVRMFNYRYLQVFLLVVALALAAHLVTLIAGHPLTGRGFQP